VRKWTPCLVAHGHRAWSRLHGSLNCYFLCDIIEAAPGACSRPPAAPRLVCPRSHENSRNRTRNHPPGPGRPQRPGRNPAATDEPCTLAGHRLGTVPGRAALRWNRASGRRRSWLALCHRRRRNRLWNAGRQPGRENGRPGRGGFACGAKTRGAGHDPRWRPDHRR